MTKIVVSFDLIWKVIKKLTNTIKANQPALKQKVRQRILLSAQIVSYYPILKQRIM